MTDLFLVFAWFVAVLGACGFITWAMVRAVNWLNRRRGL